MMRRILAIIMALILIISNGTFALALDTGSQKESFSDMPNDWSTGALTNAVDNGLLKGYQVDDKTFIYGKNPVTRAQMAAVINRAFGSTVKADISAATDVVAKEWYADEMAKAVNMKAFSMDTKLRPNDNITRQEAFVVLARVFKTASDDETYAALNTFSDRGQISNWAEKDLCGMVEAGYIKGSNGMIHPMATISRAEFAVVMDNLVKQYITQPGIITELSSNGNVLVRSDGVTLKNLTVKGDLIIGDGVGEGKAILDGVIVEGNVIVRGGGPNSIIIRGNSDIGKIILTKVNGEIRIVVEGDADIEIIYVDDGSKDVILQGTVGLMEVAGDNINVKAEPIMEGRVLITGNSSFVLFGDVTVGDTLIPAGATTGGKNRMIDPKVSIKVPAKGYIATFPGEFEINTTANTFVGVEVREEIVHSFGSTNASIYPIDKFEYWYTEPTWWGWKVGEEVKARTETISLEDEIIRYRFTFKDLHETTSYAFTYRLVNASTGITLVEATSTINVRAISDAYDVVEDFIFDKQTQTLIAYRGTADTVDIPTSIGGVDILHIGDNCFKDNKTIKTVKIPKRVTSIGKFAFSGCSLLSSINIPTGVINISDYTFNGCSKLLSISLPDGLISIGDFAFSGCHGLTGISIPAGVTSLGICAFNCCIGLTSITIPKGVTSLERGVFGVCTGLTSVSIPDGVTSIGYSAFGSCLNLPSIIIPDTVTKIHWSAFNNCDKLTSIIIPKYVTDVGKHVFAGCSKLKTVVVMSSTVEFEDNLLSQTIYGGNEFRVAYIAGATPPAIGVPGTYIKNPDGSWTREASDGIEL